MPKFIPALCLLASLATVDTASADATGTAETAVRDAENRWGEAFVAGDTNTLDQLLDAAYVSTNAAGKPRGKADIIRLAAEFAKAHPGEHAKPLSATSTVRVIGNAAVVQHHGGNETSVDVFYFKNGRWIAWYSQHTKVVD